MTVDSFDPAQKLVWRNTLYLVAAQVLAVPLSVITNVLVARFLAPTAFGHLYLATTFTTFAFLFVEFGQSGALTGLIAAQRQRSGELLGSALLWRAILIGPVSLILFAGSLWLEYSREFRVALALMLLITTLGTISIACHDVLRGYERTDIGAITFVGWKLLILVVTAPVLMAGGNLSAFLIAQAACTAIGAVVMLGMMRWLHLPRLAVRVGVVQELVVKGWPFLALALVMALRENVDAAFLAKFASADAVGWHAAARKLIGLLVYPASALVAALYPTLSRLRLEDEAKFVRTAGNALRMTVLVAAPVAAGCVLFPELGVWMFNGVTFEPTSDNLRILSVYLLLVYFSMPLSTTLMASGQHRAWVILQLLCVLVNVVLDPWLIPWCQRHFGNGGLGVCIAAALSEVAITVGGIWLARRAVLWGLFDRLLLRNVLAALLGGGAMAIVALMLRGHSSWAVAPVALLTYGLVLAASGMLNATQLAQVRSLFTK